MPTFFELLAIGSFYKYPNWPNTVCILTSKQPKGNYNPYDTVEILSRTGDRFTRYRVPALLFQRNFRSAPLLNDPLLRDAQRRVDAYPLNDLSLNFHHESALKLGQIPRAAPTPVPASLIRQNSNESDTDMFDPADYDKAFANGQIGQAAGAKSQKIRVKRRKSRKRSRR